MDQELHIDHDGNYDEFLYDEILTDDEKSIFDDVLQQFIKKNIELWSEDDWAQFAEYIQQEYQHGGAMFSVLGEKSTQHKSIKIKTHTIILESSGNQIDFFTLDKLLENFFHDVFSLYVRVHGNKNTKIGIRKKQSNVDHDIYVPFMLAEELTLEVLWKRLNSIVQSRKKIPGFEQTSNQKIIIEITVAPMIKGGAPPINWDNMMDKRISQLKPTLDVLGKYLEMSSGKYTRII